MKELEIIQHPQIEGISLFFNTMDYRTLHMHPEIEIMWIIDEPMAVNSVRTLSQYEAGDILFFNPLQPHELRKLNKSCTFLCLQISPKVFSSAYTKIENTVIEETNLRNFMNDYELNQIKQSIIRMMNIYLNKAEGYELECIGISAFLLRDIFEKVPVSYLTSADIEKRDTYNERLLRLIKFVDENYMHKIRLTDFADSRGISLNHASTFIREALGQTFQEYVNTIRFNAACKMIAGGATKMQDVCYDTGFSDYRYFSNTFQKKTGMTPEQYAKHPIDLPQAQKTHQSLHSLEHFYSQEKSIELLEKLELAFFEKMETK